MTNTEIIAKIRAEIERRIRELDEQIVDIYDSKAVLRKDELQKLLPFLDALEKSLLTQDAGGSSEISKDLEIVAIQAAQSDMQDRQIMEASNDERMLYSRIFRRGFKAGAKWNREQMMKKAVEADVMLTLHDKTGDISLHTGYLPKELGIKCDDKVKIIIVKEEEK